jgi:hypothetical protein
VSHPGYILPRVIRRYCPSPIINVAKRLHLGIIPGFETRYPSAAADRYEQALRTSGREWAGKCILVLGYGGYFGLGVELLRRGARHVILVDPFAKADDQANRYLAEQNPSYLTIQGKHVFPRKEWITLVHEEVSDHDYSLYGPIDVFLSSSVLEHVSSLEPLVSSLSKITPSDGFHIHYVDLRDHYFKYPFEMLCFPEKVWRSLLDPPSHLNRLRLWDYELYFSRYFREVSVEIIEKDLISFTQVKSRIQPEFLSGNDDQDCTTRILITAAHPKISTN